MSETTPHALFGLPYYVLLILPKQNPTDAHPQSQITRLVWLDNETLISTGQDCNTKVWQVEAI